MSKLMVTMTMVTLMVSGLSGSSYGKITEENDETLQGTLEGGVMAIGGETTGWRLKLDGGKSVDIFAKDGKNPAEDKELLGRLQKLDGKKVTVKGKTGTRNWVESGSRKYVHVESVEEHQAVKKDEKQGKEEKNEGDKKWSKEGECTGQHVGTMDIGVCGRCGGDTSSGSMKICKKCSEALGVCSFCLKKLSARPVADSTWIREGVHDPKDCCENQNHIKPIRTCERCRKGETGNGHDLCATCTKELKICTHCHRKR